MAPGTTRWAWALAYPVLGSRTRGSETSGKHSMFYLTPRKPDAVTSSRWLPVFNFFLLRVLCLNFSANRYAGARSAIRDVTAFEYAKAILQVYLQWTTESHPRGT